MKKLFCIILSVLTIISACFAENDTYGFELMPWEKSKSEVTDYLISYGWTMKYKEGFYYFTPPENIDVFYHNKLLKLKDISFTFNKEKLTSQNISINYNFSLSTALFSILNISIEDKSQLLSQELKEEDINYFIYEAKLPNCEAQYIISGNENLYLIFLSYRKFDY